MTLHGDHKVAELRLALISNVALRVRLNYDELPNQPLKGYEMKTFRNFIYSGFALCLALSSCKVSGTHTPGEDTKDGKGKEPVTKVKAPEFIEDSLRVYSGSDGILVTVATTKDGRAFVQTARTGSVIDGKVLPCEIRRTGNRREEWKTQFEGKQRIVITKNFGGGGAVDLRVWPPGVYMRGGIQVRFNQELTEKASTGALVEGYRKQVIDGSLAKIQKFDEEKRINVEQKEMESAVSKFRDSCFFSPRYTLKWESIKKRKAEKLTLSEHCGRLLNEFRGFCRYDFWRQFLKENLKEVVCKRADSLRFELSEGTLTFGYPLRTSNFWKKLRKKLLEDLRWEDGRNLAQVLNEGRSQVCTDGKGKYVGLKILDDLEKYRPSVERRLFYGNDKELRLLPPRRPRNSEGWFFDPRYVSKKAPYRWSRVSLLKINEKDGSCLLQCGKHESKLRLMGREKKMNLFKNAKMKEPLARRKPYGLARDRKGIYYYVDMAESDQVKDYRLFKGPLGNLKRMKMTNIVSDSEGDVFATPNGKLRLVLEKEHSFWMRGKKREKLINVPIEKNYTLIFNDLGVYLGQPYGTPCDIF